jgi:class 3 adenylate cyclase
MKCGECKHHNPAQSKFCNNCGALLPQPDGLAGLIGERCYPTILFSDLSGYTAMSEQFDPEDIQNIMGRIKNESVRIIERHGGLVNRFLGDEVMALFGYPDAHEDDPLRCARAANELHTMARRISEEIAEPRMGIVIRLHSGFATGLVVAIDQGNYLDGRYDVTGDAVNTAARLRSVAVDDWILCSDGSKQEIAPYFICTPIEATNLKGKMDQVVPWRVTGPTGIQSRFEVSIRRGLTHFTGRF